MEKALFITNIPAPYRIDFFNALGKKYDLTVVFEARRAKGIRFNWNEESISHFRPIFLSDGEIDEKRINPAIFRYVKKGAYDHIVATSYGYYTEMAALLYMGAAGIPYYLELDGGVARPGEAALKRAVKKRIIGKALGVFSSSASTDRVLTHYGLPADKLIRYPFTSLHEAELRAAAPDEEEKRAAKKELGICEPFAVLAVGQFIRRKGFDLLLKAAKDLPGDIGFYLAGAAPTEEYLSLSRGMDNVHYLGFLEAERLKAYFTACDLFALPTREDMWGLVVNESMAGALPVITTTACVSGMELIVSGENGFLIPPEEVGPLSDRIKTLYDDPALRRRMAENALGSIRPYTIEGMVDAHVKAFSERAGKA